MKNEYELKNAQELTHGLSTQMNYKEHIITSIINARSQLVRPVLPVFSGHLTQQERHLFELVSHYFAGGIGLGRGEHTAVCCASQTPASTARHQALRLLEFRHHLLLLCHICVLLLNACGKPSFRYRGCPLRPFSQQQLVSAEA